MFTQAQQDAERTEEADQPQSEMQTEPTQRAEEPPTEAPEVVEPTLEPVIPPTTEPEVIVPTTVPVEVLPTTVPVEVLPPTQPPVQPTEIAPTVVLPATEIPGAVTEIAPPVIPPTMVMPEQTLPTAAPQAVGLPFRELFGSNQGWAASGAWSFIDDGQVNTGWFADTASHAPESTLEYAKLISVSGLDRAQMVLRQKGAWSSADVVAVEIRPEGSDSWTPIDVQMGQVVSADWSARFIDLRPISGQTVNLRLRVASTGSDDTSTGYWLDELAIVEYTGTAEPSSHRSKSSQPQRYGSPRRTYHLSRPPSSQIRGSWLRSRCPSQLEQA